MTARTLIYSHWNLGAHRAVMMLRRLEPLYLWQIVMEACLLKKRSWLVVEECSRHCCFPHRWDFVLRNPYKGSALVRPRRVVSTVLSVWGSDADILGSKAIWELQKEISSTSTRELDGWKCYTMGPPTAEEWKCGLRQIRYSERTLP